MKLNGSLLEKVKLISLFIFLLSIPLVMATPEEYLQEFNNPEETCSYKLGFYLIDQDTVNPIMIYDCCFNQSCISIPFDINKRHIGDQSIVQEQFRIIDSIELFNQSYIDASPYYYELGFEACNLVDGYLEGQILPVTATIAGKVNPKEVKKVVRFFRTSRLIKNINPWQLGIGLSCWYVTGKEDRVMEKLHNCVKYPYYLSQNAAYYGMLDEFMNCNYEYKKTANEALDFFPIKVHNFFSLGLPWTFIPETQKATEIVETNNVYLYQASHPTQIYQNSIKRIKEKESNTNNRIELAERALNLLESSFNSMLSNEICNHIYDNAYNYTEADARKAIAEFQLKDMKNAYNIFKFNTAIAIYGNMTENILALQDSINNENTKDRHLNEWIWFFYMIAIVITLLLFWLMRYGDTIKYIVLLGGLTIIILFTLLLFIVDNTCIHTSKEHIEPFNESITNKIIIELEKPKINMIDIPFLLGPRGWPYDLIVSAYSTKNSAYTCKPNKCEFIIAGKNENGYEIKLNLSFNYSMYNDNMDFEMDASNRTDTYFAADIIAKPNLLKFVDSIAPTTNESYLKIDKRSIIISLLPNENLYYVNVSIPTIVKERQNITYTYNITINSFRLTNLTDK